jgi:hypothetical protein
MDKRPTFGFIEWSRRSVAHTAPVRSELIPICSLCEDDEIIVSAHQFIVLIFGQGNRRRNLANRDGEQGVFLGIKNLQAKLGMSQRKIHRGGLHVSKYFQDSIGMNIGSNTFSYVGQSDCPEGKGGSIPVPRNGNAIYIYPSNIFVRSSFNPRTFIDLKVVSYVPPLAISNDGVSDSKWDRNNFQHFLPPIKGLIPSLLGLFGILLGDGICKSRKVFPTLA